MKNNLGLKIKGKNKKFVQEYGFDKYLNRKFDDDEKVNVKVDINKDAVTPYDQDVEDDICAPPVVNEFKINEDPEIDTNTTVSIYGKRKTGKSFWVRWFLYNVRDVYPWGWVFTKTQNNRFYESFIPKSKILGEYSPYNLQRIVERQKDMQSHYLKYGDVNPMAFVIWDDALDNQIKHDDYLFSYYFNSRHFHTLNLMCAQHVTGTPPAIRQNTDYAILFRNTNLGAIEHLTEDFADNKDKWAFKKLMDDNTMDQSFLCVNNDPNAPPERKYFHGKAEDIKVNFTMGCRAYWNKDAQQRNDIMHGKIKEQIEKIKYISNRKNLLKLFDISNCGIQNDKI